MDNSTKLLYGTFVTFLYKQLIKEATSTFVIFSFFLVKQGGGGALLLGGS